MRKLLPLLLAVMFASGCGLMYRQPIYQGNLLEKSAVDQLQAGMDQRQVMTLLGTPSIRDPFHQDRWDYAASQRIGRTGKPEVKTLTVFFQDGVVTTWEGEYVPEQDSKLAVQVIQQFGPTLAKDKKKGGR